MGRAFLPSPGIIVQSTSLRTPKAQEVAQLLAQGDIDFAALVECKATTQADVIVFDVEVEIGQTTAFPIERHERIATVFQEDDARVPEVLALRPDFPWVQHLNLRDEEFPRSLCLYEDDYDHVKLTWAPSSFVERIRIWLRDTARGELHRDDQRLEPLLPGGAARIVVPVRLMAGNSGDGLERLHVSLLGQPENGLLCVTPDGAGRSPAGDGPSLIATTLVCGPQQHGPMRRRPKTLKELHEFVSSTGTDLLTTLRRRLADWSGDKTTLGSRLIAIVRFPKTRGSGGPVEASEIWAFATGAPVAQIGAAIGVWEIRDGDVGRLITPDETKDGGEITINTMNPIPTLSRRLAAHCNGLDEPDDTGIVAVGVGALGSQVTMNLARAGIGNWVLVDDDIVLPHNLARHALDASAVGRPKAQALADVINGVLEGGPAATAIVSNVLRPGSHKAGLDAALEEADVILDMSASVPAARCLARDVKSDARRISVFLNRRGTDLVVVAEDKARRFPLDMLEIQYYRAVVANPALRGHMSTPTTRVRYGGSCRDVSVTMPQSLVGMLAGIASGSLQKLIGQDMAAIWAWRVNTDGHVAAAVEVPPAEVLAETVGDWTLITDSALWGRLCQLRAEKLPNETGGVLIGASDMQRKIIYVVDTIPSPPDSKEWPTLYIRGAKGLAARVDEFNNATDGMLQYVGEWHSHPAGASPSSDDLLVRGWLAKWMQADGLPPLMFVIGDAEYGRLLGPAVTVDAGPTKR